MHGTSHLAILPLFWGLKPHFVPLHCYLPLQRRMLSVLRATSQKTSQKDAPLLESQKQIGSAGVRTEEKCSTRQLNRRQAANTVTAHKLEALRRARNGRGWFDRITRLTV